MSLATYNDLKAAIVEWPDLVGEPTIQNAVGTLIALAEATINQDPRLRLAGHMTTLHVVSGTPEKEHELPDDCLQVAGVFSDDGEPVVPTSVSGLSETSLCGGFGGCYAIDGLRLVFSEARETFSLRYYQRPPALETASTHWLFAKAPDLYLFGSLIQAAIFSKEFEQETSRYNSAYEACISRLTGADWDMRFPFDQPLRSVVW